MAGEASNAAMAAALNSNTFQFVDDQGNQLILNSVLGTFEHAAHDGFVNLTPEAMWLVGVFAIINICTTWTLYDGEMRLSQMISQIMKIGAFFFLILNMGKINQAIMLSFQKGGLLAALGPSGMNDVSALSPSGLLDKGVKIIGDLYKGSNVFTIGVGGTIEKYIVMLLVIFSFFFMSIQLMLTKIEFNIFAAIAVILLPFGALRFTSFLFQRAVSSVFAFGVKLMVCYFMLGIVVKQSDTLLQALPTKMLARSLPGINWMFTPLMLMSLLNSDAVAAPSLVSWRRNLPNSPKSIWLPRCNSMIMFSCILTRTAVTSA